MCSCTTRVFECQCVCGWSWWSAGFGKSINPHHIIRLTDTLWGYKSQKYIHTDISMHTWILVAFGLGLWANFYWRCGTTSGLSLFALAGFVAGANLNILMKKDCILAMDTVSTGLCLSENWLCLSLPYFTSHWIQIELASYITDNLRVSFEYACPSENLLTNSGCFRVDMSKLEVDFPFKFRYILVFSYEKTIIKQDHVMKQVFWPI